MTNELETYVRKVARTLHENQIARLYKIPNDIKIAEGVLVHAEQTPVDFIGFTATGRVILVECKVCKRASLPMDRTGLKPHQWIALQEAHDSGGLGLLVWKREDYFTVLDVDQIRHFSVGRKSIPWFTLPVKYRHPWGCVAEIDFFSPYLSAQTEGSDWRSGRTACSPAQE